MIESLGLLGRLDVGIFCGYRIGFVFEEFVEVIYRLANRVGMCSFYLVFYFYFRGVGIVSFVLYTKKLRCREVGLGG